VSGPGPLKTFLDIQGLKALKALRATVNPHLVSELLISEIFRQTFYGHKLRKKEKVIIHSVSIM